MKTSKYVKTYAIASQGIFSMAIMAGIGYLIGYLIFGSLNVWSFIFALIGLFIGFFSLMAGLMKIAKEQDKDLKDLKPIEDNENEEEND